MSDVLWFVFGMLVFVTVLALSIGLHELGHYVVARKFGIQVPKFFVGFGPTLFSGKKYNTEWGVKAIPLGGYISVEDTRYPEESRERTELSYVTPWKRILIFLGGPMVNILLGYGILMVILTAQPGVNVTNTIDHIVPCSDKVKVCPAEQSGLQAGDTIVKLDGVSNPDFNSREGLFSVDGSDVVVERNGEFVDLTVTPDANGKMGIVMVSEPWRRTPVDSFHEVNEYLGYSLKALITIPEKMPNIFNSIAGQEERDTDTVSSIVGAGRLYGDVATHDEYSTELKLTQLVFYSGAINLGLGLANLLPLMPLDGGRIAIAMVDSVKWNWAKLRKREYVPFGQKYVVALTAVTGGLVAMFMITVIVADIVAPVAL